MKRKLLTFILVLGTGIVAIAQSKSAIQEVYNTFEDRDNVISLTLNKTFSDFLDTDFDWGDQMKNIKGDVKKISTLIISEDDNSKKMMSRIKRMIDNMDYIKIDIPEEDINTDDDEEVYMYAKGKKERYSEIHVLVIEDDEEGVLLSLFGDFTIKHIE